MAAYLIASGELNVLPNLQDDPRKSLARLANVLDGTGLLKPRHMQVLIAMIDDLCADARNVWDRLNPEEREVMDDMAAQVAMLRRGGWPPYR